MPAAISDDRRSYGRAKPPVAPGASPAKPAAKDDLVSLKPPLHLRSSAGTGAPLSHTEQWKSLLRDVMEGSIIVEPACAHSTDDTGTREQALLVWLPGALMKPSNYKSVAESINQQMVQFAPELELWVAIPDIDFFKLNTLVTSLEQQQQTPPEAPATPTTPTSPSSILTLAIPAEPVEAEDDLYAMPTYSKDAPDKLLQIAIQQVISNTRFKPRLVADEPGRHLNVAVAMHSASGLLFTDPACKSADVLMFVQSSPTPTVMASTHKSSAWAASSHPILMLLGQSDGQMMFSNMLSEATASAWVAQSEGAVAAATRKPCVCVPGLNHAQMCGVPNMYHRGDCATTASPEDTKAAAAKVAAAFLAVQFAARDKRKLVTEQCPKAVEFLVQQNKTTATWLKPFASANGIHDLEAAWAAGQALDAGEDELAIQLSARSALARPVLFGPNVGVTFPLGVFGPPTQPGKPQAGPAPMCAQLREFGPVSYSIPVVLPNQITMAEKEVATLQEAIVRSTVTAGLLPASVLDKLRVRVSVQPTVPTLEEAHCSVSLAPGGSIVVRVHAFMHWPMLDKRLMQPPGFHCASHCLWVKLKGAAALAQEASQLLGLPAPTADKCQGAEISARALNAAVMQRALALVTEAARNRYEQQGVPLEFAPDVYSYDPHVWAANTRMTFKVSKTGGAATTDDLDAPPAPVHRGGQVVHVHSPVFNLSASSGVAAALPEHVDGLRAHGTMCAKVMSLAQAVEWIMLGAHRQVNLAPEQGCFWGGHGAPEPQPTIPVAGSGRVVSLSPVKLSK